MCGTQVRRWRGWQLGSRAGQPSWTRHPELFPMFAHQLQTLGAPASNGAATGCSRMADMQGLLLELCKQVKSA